LAAVVEVDQAVASSWDVAAVVAFSFGGSVVVAAF
jgi:hypothetical protein